MRRIRQGSPVDREFGKGARLGDKLCPLVGRDHSFDQLASVGSDQGKRGETLVMSDR